MSRPTIADLAKAADVGISTVDRVLNGRLPVRAQTAQKVLEAAERIGFHGVGAIKRRMESDKPTVKFGFLLKQPQRKLYRMWGGLLTSAVEQFPHAHGRAIIRFMDDLSPNKSAQALYSLSREADVIGAITSDHPQVNHAVDALAAEGIPVVTMISDLSASTRAAYVGNDCAKKGRTAAWYIERLNHKPGKVAVFVGSHRYLHQELCEMGFRSHFRENAPAFQVLDTQATLEEPAIAYDFTVRLLKSEPNWVGLYVAGGGITGVMEALRQPEFSERRKSLIVVAHELTNETKTGLAEGLITAVLAHPASLLAETLVQTMMEVLHTEERAPPKQKLLPFEIFTMTNI